MHFITPTLLLASLASLASADFYVSNSSVCMGAFPLDGCYRGVQVLSGTSNTTDYTCSKLMHAEDNNYLYNGTVGQHGSNAISDGGICNSGKLIFQNVGQSYHVNDTDGNQVATCDWVNATLSTPCNQLLGGFYFAATFLCTSTICS